MIISFSVATLKNSKTPENPRSNLYRFCGKIELFLDSSTLIFKFVIFNGPKTEKTTTRSLLFHQKPLAFHQKTLQNMYFSGKSEKTQKNPRFFENPRKILGLQEKTQNPRSGRKTPDLGRKP